MRTDDITFSESPKSLKRLFGDVITKEPLEALW
jgi:hypothetical protein